MRVVSRKGYDHVTVQAIADEAGVAKGTVYLYFKSREDVLEKTMSFSFEDFHLSFAKRSAAARRFASASNRSSRGSSRTASRTRSSSAFIWPWRSRLGSVVCANTPRTGRTSRNSCRWWRAPSKRVKSERQPPERIAIASVVRDIGLQRMAEKNKRPIAEDIDFVRDFICRGIATAEEKPA